MALYAALAFGNRGSVPVGDPLYFVVVVVMAIVGLVLFAVDRFVEPRIAGPTSTPSSPWPGSPRSSCARVWREARAGARLVAWPEASFLVLAHDEAAALQRAQLLAAKEHI